MAERHFDPWGQPIKVEDGAGNALDKLTLLDRGFTGHEHLQTVGFIHMNGRLYDPALHRFLQPDNYVQDLIQPYILRLIFSLFFYVCCFKLLNVIKALLERLSIIGDFVLSLIISS
nr:RHS repeat-associated core domain-containing protein [Capnocytophaga ochracea]